MEGPDPQHGNWMTLDQYFQVADQNKIRYEKPKEEQIKI